MPPTQLTDQEKLDGMRECRDRLTEQWKKSEHYKQQAEWIRNTIFPLRTIEIDQALCVGLGSMTGNKYGSWKFDEFYEHEYPDTVRDDPRKSGYSGGLGIISQLVAFECWIEVLREHFQILDDEIYFQEPSFQRLDVEFLHSLGYTVLDAKKREAEELVSDSTFLFSCLLFFNVIADLYANAHPTFCVMTGLWINWWSNTDWPGTPERSEAEIKRIVKRYVERRLASKIGPLLTRTRDEYHLEIDHIMDAWMADVEWYWAPAHPDIVPPLGQPIGKNEWRDLPSFRGIARCDGSSSADITMMEGMEERAKSLKSYISDAVMPEEEGEPDEIILAEIERLEKTREVEDALLKKYNRPHSVAYPELRNRRINYVRRRAGLGPLGDDESDSDAPQAPQEPYTEEDEAEINVIVHAMMEVYKGMKNMWKATQPYKEQQRFIEETIFKSEGIELNSALCMGVGRIAGDRYGSWTFDDDYGTVKYNHEDSLEHLSQVVAFDCWVELLASRYGIPRQNVYFQEPDFNIFEIRFIEKLGYKVIFDPGALQKISDKTFLFSVFLYKNIVAELLGAAHPCLAIMSPLDVISWLTGGNRVDVKHQSDFNRQRKAIRAFVRQRATRKLGPLFPNDPDMNRRYLLLRIHRTMHAWMQDAEWYWIPNDYKEITSSGIFPGTNQRLWRLLPGPTGVVAQYYGDPKLVRERIARENPQSPWPPLPDDSDEERVRNRNAGLGYRTAKEIRDSRPKEALGG